MAVSPGFIDFVVEQLEGCGPIVTKRMFGGVGIYSGDTFFAIIDNDILYLKVDDTTRKDFEREGCAFPALATSGKRCWLTCRCRIRMPTNPMRGASWVSRWLPRRNPAPAASK
jgi:TfoX/Sxy family transcriptional regulator of competence genes